MKTTILGRPGAVLRSVGVATMTFSLLLTLRCHGAVIIVNPPSSIVFQDEQGFLGAWSLEGTEITAAGLLTPSQTGDTRWKVAGMGDFNNDGNPDLLFQHADGTLATWLMKGAELIEARLLNPNQLPEGWRVAGVADFRQDGHSDLLLQHADGSVGFWLMNGTDLVLPALFQQKESANPNWRVITASDFNHDGSLDLFYQHSDGSLGIGYLSPALPSLAKDLVKQHENGERGPWYMNGMVVKSEVMPYSVDAAWRAVGTTDFTGDGNSDILFQHQDGTMATWTMEGSGLVSAQTFGPTQIGTSWKARGVIGISTASAASAKGSE